MTIMCQLKQQVLRAWQPIPTLTKTIVLFLVLGSLFLGVGVPLVILSQGIVEYRVQYDTVCGNQPACQISLNITTTMQGPVFVYYELTNYFQNHRLYAKSLSA